MKFNKLILLTLALFNKFALAEQVTNESQLIASSDDTVVGTAPDHVTVSSAGAALEQSPISINSYGFFSQTLANGLYYEARVYLNYNTLSQNPNFPEVSASNINNPLGNGVAGFIGYNFNVTDILDILPYIRVNLNHNMNLVYEDSNGNFIHSNAWATFIGSKFAFKLDKRFVPYFNYYIGYQRLYMTGEDAYVTSPISTEMYQIVSNYQLGLGIKASSSISVIPYITFSTIFNNPSDVAGLPLNQGGFGVTPLTVTQQIIGTKLSYTW